MGIKFTRRRHPRRRRYRCLPSCSTSERQRLVCAKTTRRNGNVPRTPSSPSLRAPCLLRPGRCTASSPRRRALSILRRAACRSRLCTRVRIRDRFHDRNGSGRFDSPKLASGFSALTRSLQSWLKNMYADSARFGAFGSLPFLPFGAFSTFSAALRCKRTRHVSHDSLTVRKGRKKRKTSKDAMGDQASRPPWPRAASARAYTGNTHRRAMTNIDHTDETERSQRSTRPCRPRRVRSSPSGLCAASRAIYEPSGGRNDQFNAPNDVG